MAETTIVVAKSEKNVGIAILLSFLFGPLGMLYSTITGGIIMLVINLIVAVFTLGLGLILTWPICVVWGAIAANNYNKELANSVAETPAVA